MDRAHAAVVTVLLVAAGSAAQEAAAPAPQAAEIPLYRVELDFDAMETAVPQVYDLTLNAESSTSGPGFQVQSTVTLATDVLDTSVVLRDVWELMGREYRMALHCDRIGGLPLLRGQFEMLRRGQLQTALMSVRDGQLFVEADGDCVDLEHPQGTLLQAAAFRIIPQLPRVAGAGYTFAAYGEPLEMNVRSADADHPHRIICRGPASVQLETRTVDCTKYSLLAGRKVDFFVDADDRLVQAVADGGATVMTLREPVMSVSEDGEH